MYEHSCSETSTAHANVNLDCRGSQGGIKVIRILSTSRKQQIENRLGSSGCGFFFFFFFSSD